MLSQAARRELEERELSISLQLLEARRKDQLSLYLPYPKQLEFHAARARERLLVAGNQTGKSYGISFEVAMHLTGIYPSWWTGHRFKGPILCWTGSNTNESSKEIIQPALLGTEDASMSVPDMGAGAIPGRMIRRVTTRQAGVKNVVDEIMVRHVSGRESRCSLKTYEQGAAKWMGKPVDLIWLDEEPPEDIYGECVARTQKTGGYILLSFTPLKGKTPVYERFANPGPDDRPRHMTRMTIHDAMHYTPENCDEILASYNDWERECRAMGLPMAGHGRVFPFTSKEISCKPMQIPAWWRRICGIDFGIDHPGAAVWIALDPDTDIVYLYDCYRKSRETAVYHAAAINGRGKWIPVAWPHDGLQKDKGSGQPLYMQYLKNGVKVLPMSARYEDDKGGSQAVEPVVMDLIERMKTGRFKAFEGLGDFFEEAAYYHRKDGKIVSQNDDIVSALRYALMMLRYASNQKEPAQRRPRYTQPMIS
jgi:phage terminase large subunit-like protein